MKEHKRPYRAGPPSAHEEDDAGFDMGQFRRYLHAPLRRPWLTVIPWVAILLLSVAAFFTLPKRYKSSTLILVESERVPESFVPKVATPDRVQGLEAIRPEILSRTRLERVVDETQPYPDNPSRTSAVEALRRSIAVNASGNDGFTVEFVHKDPRKAQEVVNRVATLFIEETIKSRTEQVEGAVDFLATQVADARRELAQKDEALRLYKERRMGKLPEQLQSNLATMQMLQHELQSVEENMIFAREKRDSAARSAGSPASPAATGGTSTGQDELNELRRQLAALRSHYTDEHPDVLTVRARIARLEERLARAASAEAASGAPPAAEPATSAAREQLATASLEVKRLEDKRVDLEARIAQIRQRVEDTPTTEQELANLKRDYDKLSENYEGLLSKELEARMGARLEQRWRGQRFRTLDPANLPEKPYFPKALLIIGLGFALGMLAGIGASVVVEFLDPSIKDTQDLEGLIEHPVLARIPHVPSLGARRAPMTR